LRILTVLDMGVSLTRTGVTCATGIGAERRLQSVGESGPLPLPPVGHHVRLHSRQLAGSTGRDRAVHLWRGLLGGGGAGAGGGARRDAGGAAAARQLLAARRREAGEDRVVRERFGGAAVAGLHAGPLGQHGRGGEDGELARVARLLPRHCPLQRRGGPRHLRRRPDRDRGAAHRPGRRGTRGDGAVEPYGTTGLYDAVAMLPEISLGSGGAKRAAVLVTDGVDNVSAIGPQQAQKLVQAADLPVYVLALPGRDDGNTPAGSYRYGDLLRELAESTGGRYYELADAGEARRTCAAILGEL